MRGDSEKDVLVRERVWLSDEKLYICNEATSVSAVSLCIAGWQKGADEMRINKKAAAKSGAITHKNNVMNIGIFCSANADIDPDFFRLTREFGAWMALHRHQLVFGGCNLGLMECIAEAVKQGGGTTVGVVPSIVERGGRASRYVDVKVLCDNLSDRKDLIISRSDVIIALPGGVGTLDEVFTVLAAASIGYNNKSVILYDMKGFWRPLLTMIDEMKAAGVLRSGFEQHLLVAENLDDIAHLIGEQ